MAIYQLIQLDEKTQQPIDISIITDSLDIRNPVHLNLWLCTLNSLSFDEEMTIQRDDEGEVKYLKIVQTDMVELNTELAVYDPESDDDE